MSGSDDGFSEITKMKILFTLWGVLLPLATANQSEIELPDLQPITGVPVNGEKRQLETPEVVLQLKYDRGELNRIYLAQFRKNKDTWAPAVPVADNLCTDLCHAGLGGKPCGPTCAALIPVGLQSLLRASNETDATYGEPRTAVCPALCQYNLGDPLCSCTSPDEVPVVWTEVCAAFCLADNFVLGGCPACTEQTTSELAAITAGARVLSTAEGWTAWCNAQCRQGHGGAACNCDRTPFQ